MTVGNVSRERNMEKFGGKRQHTAFLPFFYFYPLKPSQALDECVISLLILRPKIMIFGRSGEEFDSFFFPAKDILGKNKQKEHLKKKKKS